MTRCLIIASAAYIGAEMQAELGKLPPAFLPVGGRRLFVHQHAALKAYVDQVYLSLPEGFAVNVVDQSLLQDLKITPIFVPEGLTLGQSIVYVINVTAGSGSEIRILHGDTLVENVDASLSDAVSVSHQPPSGYDWGTLAVDDDETFLNPLERGSFGAGNPALTGYFSFSRPTLLVQEITRRKGDFVAGVTKYAETVPLTLIADCRWNDFGHIRTYYRSRRSMTTEREFNSLAQGPRYVEKSGD